MNDNTVLDCVKDPPKGRPPVVADRQPANGDAIPIAEDVPTSEYVEWVLRLFIDPGQVTELRAPKVIDNPRYPEFVYGGFFDWDNLGLMAKYAVFVSPHAEATYFLFNPLDPELLCVQRNVAKRKPKASANADHVLRRRWLVFDQDPARISTTTGKKLPPTMSATDGERALARERTDTLIAHLTGMGWPEPIRGDSGNGFHVWHRIDLPTDDGGLVAGVLKAANEMFGDDQVTIDTTLSDPNRPIKLYGTQSRKGENDPLRPHRVSRIMEVPGERPVVPEGMLRAFIDSAPKPKTVVVLNGAGGPRGGNRPASDRSSAIERARAYIAKMPDSIEGDHGHSRLFAVACALVDGFGLTEDEAEPLFRKWNEEHAKPPEDERQVLHKLADAIRNHPVPSLRLLNAERNGHGNGTPRPLDDRTREEPVNRPDDSEPEIPLTDMGNAKRLAKLLAGNAHYCPPWKAWLFHDGRRWADDKTLQIKAAAKRVPVHILTEIPPDPSPEKKQAKPFIEWAHESQARRRIDDMIDLARCEPGIPIGPDQFDSDPWLLNVLNGTIDLRTGELRPHRKSDRITKLCPVEYHPKAQCPRWEQFEIEVFGGDLELIRYVRRAIGYSLTAVDTVQEINIFHGGGSNGKNVYLDTIREIMGDYGSVADPDLLLADKNGGRHPTGLADLHGRRFVLASETDDGRQLAEALVKRLTGDRTIKARFMHQNFFEFARTFKIFLITNYEPEVRGADEAIWRRIRMIPFRVHFEKDPTKPIDPPRVMRADLDLAEALRKELAGILSLMVRGCLDWQAHGMSPPKAVIAATQGYRDAMDSVRGFLEMRCTSFLDHPQLRDQARVRVGDLFAAYTAFIKDIGFEGDKALSSRRFGSEMERRGYRLVPSNSQYWRCGIQLKD